MGTAVWQYPSRIMFIVSYTKQLFALLYSKIPYNQRLDKGMETDKHPLYTCIQQHWGNGKQFRVYHSYSYGTYGLLMHQ